MGLTNSSVGRGVNKKFEISPKSPDMRVIALAGNPNVGKSTVFNSLTGMKQHTGNWTGKTVSNAQGEYRYNGKTYILVDVPGTYSLTASSVEEEYARDFICFGGADAVAVVADATCLERNLNLVLQIAEAVPKFTLCVNLLDEAKKKGIVVDLDELSLQLGTEVTGVCARQGIGLEQFKKSVETVSSGNKTYYRRAISYPKEIEKAVFELEKAVRHQCGNLNSRWLSLRLLEYDESMKRSVDSYLKKDILADPEVSRVFEKVSRELEEQGYGREEIRDAIVGSIVERAERIAGKCVMFTKEKYDSRDRRLDRLFTSKATGIPIMLLMLGLIFWLTIVGANYPSQLLSDLFGKLEKALSEMLLSSSLPPWVEGLFVKGMFRTLSWVTSVMLPPMAIFFPLFTILEDFGYLPRVAFNLDKFFRKAGTHGKQSLTMCMGKFHESLATC